MQTIVKKWFQDKEYGFLENGTAKDIMVRKSELINCSFLKVGAIVEFECHIDKRGLIAKKVKLSRKKNNTQNGSRNARTHPFGVMT
ncbi:MAG: cold shock domain-containing protein [Pseudomonadota bacterium]